VFGTTSISDKVISSDFVAIGWEMLARGIA